MKKKNTSIAQAIMELMIFGSIILFILGLIIRFAVSFSDSENVQLKAMREAMKLSAKEMEGSAPKGQRKVATVLWIEDRPTIQGGEKYGSSTRTPFIAYGTGSMTNQTFYSPDLFEFAALPVFEMVINGQRFTFRTAGFKDYCHSSDSYCWPNGPGAHLSFNAAKCDATGGWAPDPDERYNCEWCKDDFCTNNLPDEYEHPWKNQREEILEYNGWRTYAFLYTKIPKNHFKFCVNQWEQGKHHCVGLTEEELNRRFDLRRDGNPVPAWPPELRQRVAWQWYPVFLSAKGMDLYGTAYNSLDIDGDLKEETFVYGERHSGDGWTEKFYNHQARADHKGQLQWVIPRDGHEEDHGLTDSSGVFGEDIIDYTGWIDYQEGDIDLTYDALDAKWYKTPGYEWYTRPKPGLLPETKIYSLTTPGNETRGTFSINQTKTGNQRSTVSKKTYDSYDIIERKVQLSNHTGCFCPQNDVSTKACLEASPQAGSIPLVKPGYCNNDNTNVEVACKDDLGGYCCEQGDKQRETCLDYSGHKLLYVRSRIESKKGRRFKTEDVVDNYDK